MINVRKTILAVSVPVTVCIIQYSFETPYGWNVLWWLAYAVVWGTIKWYRFHYRFEIGVYRDLYWIRFSIVLLYCIGIVGLGFLDFIRIGWSLTSTISLHIVLLAYFLVEDYIEKHLSWRTLDAAPRDQISRWLTKVGRFLIGLLMIIFLFVILPGFRKV